ncbi:hypothetical protein CH292_26245 [Rhodococcus sp. 14-2470-1a]|nr:hypothetical protein CH292_26245 [Rhodococcus sp. 14-2470-1a]
MLHFQIGAGHQELIATNFGGGTLGAQWVDGSNIIQQARFDYNGGTQYWSKIGGARGRLLPMRPIDPRVGIFEARRGQLETSRINVNGFGALVYRENGILYVRVQVVGANGMRYYTQTLRTHNTGPVQSALDAFLDTAYQLNLQYANYRVAAAQWGAAALPGIAVGAGGLIVAGATPVTIIALIAAATAATIGIVGNIRTQMNTYMTTYNVMIDRFQRLMAAANHPVPDIAGYNVGNMTWNRYYVTDSAAPPFEVLSIPR